jgi:opacity protein-like surface antigen
MKRLLLLVLALVMLAAPASAADVDGTWTGLFDTPNGAVNVSFTFKADGDNLTGTTTGPAGEIAIKDGKVDGNKISFNISIEFGGMPLLLAYTGLVSPEEIKLTLEVMGMPFEFVVKKAK